MNPIQQAISALEDLLTSEDFAQAERYASEVLTSLRSLNKEVEGVELPALPTPWDFAYVWNTPGGQHRSFSANHYNGSPCTSQAVLFTNDQMHAYARTAIAAALGREADVKPDLFCTCGNEWQWNTDAGAWELVASFIPDEVPEATQPTQDSEKPRQAEAPSEREALTAVFLQAMEWGRDYWSSFSMRGQDQQEIAEQFADKARAALATPPATGQVERDREDDK